jgi:hypothetical protein
MDKKKRANIGFEKWGMIFIYFWTSLSSSCFFLVAPYVYKVKKIL